MVSWQGTDGPGRGIGSVPSEALASACSGLGIESVMMDRILEGHLKPRERLQGDRGVLMQVWKTQKKGGAEGAEAEKDGQRYRKKTEIQREGKKGSEVQGERERDPGRQGENKAQRKEDRTETQRQGTETQERGHRCRDPEP